MNDNGHQKREHQLVGDIYDAALEPALWPSVLAGIVKVAGANSATLTAVDTLNPDYTFAFNHNIPDSVMQVYRDEGFDVQDMELHGRATIRKGVGKSILSSELYGTQEAYVEKAGAYYERIQIPSNVHYFFGTLLEYSDFRYAALGVHRPADWAPMTEADAALGERLGQHLRRALQIHRQLTAVRHHNLQLYKMLDGLVAGVVLISHTGKVRYANPRAENILKRHGALQLCAKEGLQAALPSQNQALQILLQGAIRTGKRENTNLTGGVLGLQRIPGETPLMLTITPLSELTGYGELASDGAAAAVFVTDPDMRHVLSRKLLQQSYGLSEREGDVCSAFVNHPTLEGAAESCGLSLATVRTYLREIYGKTGQHSQAELMRLLLGLTLDFEHIR